jgi:formyl-CoA transferase
MRDHQRLQHGPLIEFSVPTEGLTDVPRGGNDSGGGQLGNALKCKGGGINDYLYVVVQEAIWPALANLVGGEKLAHDARFAKIGDRRANQKAMWRLLNEFASHHTKRELMAIFNEIDVPCGPVLGTEDLANDEHLRAREMYVEMDHKKRGKHFTVGMPIKLSASPAVITPAPLLGEHTDEVLKEVLGYTDEQIAAKRAAGAFGKV